MRRAERREYFRDIGRALKLLRDAAGLTQGELAARTNHTVRKTQISSYENERAQPNLVTLGHLLNALDADLTSLERALSLADRAGAAGTTLEDALELRTRQREEKGGYATNEETPAFLVLDLRRRGRRGRKMVEELREYVELSQSVLRRVEREEGQQHKEESEGTLETNDG